MVSTVPVIGGGDKLITMDTKIKKTIAKVAVNTQQNYIVDVKIGGKIVSSINVTARDKEHAKEKAFYLLRFDIKKGY